MLAIYSITSYLKSYVPNSFPKRTIPSGKLLDPILNPLFNPINPFGQKIIHPSHSHPIPPYLRPQPRAVHAGILGSEIRWGECAAKESAPLGMCLGPAIDLLIIKGYKML